MNKKIRSFMSSVLADNLMTLENEKIMESHKRCRDRVHVQEEIE